MTSYKKTWWISLFIKLVFAALVPLSADEAYYWVWTHFPQLSYFDHPPMVAWLLKVGDYFPTWAIRWPGLLLFHGSLLLWFEILSAHFSEKQILRWLLVLLLCPLTGLGSTLALPDTPLFIFFTLSLYAFWNALKSGSPYYFILFGASLGLGFLSKYIIVIPALLFVFFILFQNSRAALKPKNIILVLTSGLVFSLPVLIWNFQNDFGSFRFQLRHGLNEGSWQPEWTVAYLAGTLFLAYPPFLFSIFRRPQVQLFRLLQLLALGGLGFFAFSSTRGSVELNWPSIFYPCLFAVAVANDPHLQLRRFFIYWTALYGVLITLATTGLAPALRDKVAESYQLFNLRSLATEYAPLYTTTYQLASLMWWNSKTPVYKLKDSSRYDFFDQRSESVPTADVFYVLKEKDNNLPEWIGPRFRTEELLPLDEKRRLIKVTRKDAP